MDLKAFLTDGPPVGFNEFLENGAKKPLIAAVEGFALAGGLEVALTCDLIVAAEGVKLGIPEVGVGFSPQAELAPVAKSCSICGCNGDGADGRSDYCGKRREYGLVSRVTEKGGAVEGAMELADRIARNAPLSVAASKQMIQAVQGRTEAEFWEHQRPVMAAVFSSEDAKEGSKAFAEKRPPS